jgi:sugar phosphate isomerase/epimerase
MVDDKNVDKVVEDAVDAGLKYVIHPWMKGGDMNVFKKMAENLNKYGEKFRKAGIRYGYHNHSFEFEAKDGVLPYDVLLQGTDPDLVIFEMDLFWITKGGHDPWEYFAKYPGRFEIWHVKDMKGTADRDMTEVGNGVIDFKKIFHLKDQAGMKYYFVEQDTCKDHTPLESVKISLDYLKKKNF